MIQVTGSRVTISDPEFRMVAEPRLAMRGPGAMEDRETVEEYSEEREIDNECSESDEFKETMEYSEYMQQTLRLCSEMEEMTVAMVKMNLKLPKPTLYDGKSPQLNEWAEEVKSYRLLLDSPQHLHRRSLGRQCQ
eukprot:2861096-Amphidinium_carterae.1